MPSHNLIVVFVNGRRVISTGSCRDQAARRRNEAPQRGLGLEVRLMFLGRCVTIQNKIRLPDLLRAFNTEIDDELGPLRANEIPRRMHAHAGHVNGREEVDTQTDSFRRLTSGDEITD